MENQDIKKTAENKRIVLEAMECGFKNFSFEVVRLAFLSCDDFSSKAEDIWSKIYSACIETGHGTFFEIMSCAVRCDKKIFKDDLERILKNSFKEKNLKDILTVSYALGRGLSEKERITAFKLIIRNELYDVFLEPFLKKIKPPKRVVFLEKVMESCVVDLEARGGHFCMVKLAKIIGRELTESEKRKMYDFFLKDQSIYDRFSQKEVVDKISDLEIEYILKELEIFVKEASEDSLNNSKILAEMLSEPLRSEWLLKIAALQSLDQALLTLKMIQPRVETVEILLSFLKKEGDLNNVIKIIEMIPPGQAKEDVESVLLFFLKKETIGIRAAKMISFFSNERKAVLVKTVLLKFEELDLYYHEGRFELLQQLSLEEQIVYFQDEFRECLLGTRKNSGRNASCQHCELRDRLLTEEWIDSFLWKLLAQSIKERNVVRFNLVKEGMPRGYWENNKTAFYADLSKEELLFVLSI